MSVQEFVTLILNNLGSFDPIMTKYQSDENFLAALDYLKTKYPDVINGLVTTWQGRQDYEAGKISANDLLGIYGQQGSNSMMTPETEKWLDNEIARENAIQQQQYEISARDTSLLSTADQLGQLGLSSSNVVSLGGASAGVQGSTADTMTRSNSALRQQFKINKFNQEMGLAKSLIGAASSMASSGIYGAAIGAVKHSAQAIAGSAAHSGLQALKSIRSQKWSGQGNGSLLSGKLGEEWSKLPNAY